MAKGNTEVKTGKGGRPVLHMKKVEVPLPGHATASVSADEHPSVRDIKDRVEALFNALGTDAMPETCYPTGGRNNGAEAAEYVLAEQLAKLADKRKKEAFEAAQKKGVFGDPKEYVAGETQIVWASGAYVISMKVGNPTFAINRENTEAAAEKYLGKKADEFLEACKQERKPTQQVIVSLK
jgi:hypothetical protein